MLRINSPRRAPEELFLSARKFTREDSRELVMIRSPTQLGAKRYVAEDGGSRNDFVQILGVCAGLLGYCRLATMKNRGNGRSTIPSL